MTQSSFKSTSTFKKIVANFKILKYSIYFFLKFYDLTLGGFLYWFSKKYASVHTRLTGIMDWGFAPTTPSSYKHEINLYNWRFDPTQVEFVEIAYGRMQLRRNDTVLDLCCGDGSYSYLFFSDISKRVDAIDYDSKSIQYASRNYARENIKYICNDILQYSYIPNEYDLVVWASGVAYFTIDERTVMFKKILFTLKDNGQLYIRTPLEEMLTTGANQRSVIVNKEDFEREFDGFQIISCQKSFYDKRVNLNYVLKKNS